MLGTERLSRVVEQDGGGVDHRRPAASVKDESARMDEADDVPGLAALLGHLRSAMGAVPEGDAEPLMVEEPVDVGARDLAGRAADRGCVTFAHES